MPRGKNEPEPDVRAALARGAAEPVGRPAAPHVVAETFYTFRQIEKPANAGICWHSQVFLFSEIEEKKSIEQILRHF